MDHEGKTSDDLILTRWVMDFQQAELEQLLERQLVDAQARIREMIHEIDRRDELITDLQRRIQELEQARNSQP